MSFRVRVPITGSKSRGGDWSEAINLRVVDGVLTPRPAFVKTITNGVSLGTTEKFVGLGSYNDVNNEYVLGVTHDSQTLTGRFLLSQNGGDFQVRQSKLLESSSGSNTFSSNGKPPEFLRTGDRWFVNTHKSFWDIIWDNQYIYRIFQMEWGRLNLTGGDFDEAHTLPVLGATWNASRASNISSNGVVGNNYRVVTSAGDFSFGFDLVPYSTDLWLYGQLPNNSYELILVFSCSSGSGNLRVVLIDSYGHELLLPSSYFSLTNNSELIRRFVLLDYNKLLAGKQSITGIKFYGTGFSGGVTLDFNPVFSTTGTYVFSSVTTDVPDIPVLRLSLGHLLTVPDGVGLPSEPRVPLNLGGSPFPGVTRDGFALVLYLNCASPIPDSMDFIHYYLTSAGRLAKIEPVLIDQSTVMRKWLVDDVRDVTLAYNGFWAGRSFPQVEASTTPELLSICIWNGRLCIATSMGQLWISSQSDLFGFDESVGGDVLTLPFRPIQLVPTDNALFITSDQGLKALAGEPAGWVVRDANRDEGRASGSSSRFLIQKSGVWSTAGAEVTTQIRNEVYDPLVDIITADETRDGAFVVTEDTITGEVVLWENFRSNWLRFRVAPEDGLGSIHTAAWVPGRGLCAIGSEGLCELKGVQVSDWEYSTLVSFDQPAIIRSVEVVGQGNIDCFINNHPVGTGVELPVLIQTELYPKGYEFIISLRGSGVVDDEVFIENVYLEYEPLQARELD